MSIHKLIQEAMEKHKAKIELTQWAVISSFASMVYSDYIYHFVQKQHPTPHVQVPAISNLRHFLSKDGKFLKLVSQSFFEKLMQDELFNSYITLLPELEMFHGDNVEIMETIFDLYILPNVSRHIPHVISHKFQLEDPGKQAFRESVDIPVMELQSEEEYDQHITYLVREFVLQLLLLCPTLQRESVVPESNYEFLVQPTEILSINSDVAICPIHFTPSIWESSPKLLAKIKFVTNTERFPNEDSSYQVKTNAFNQVTLTTLESVETLVQRIDPLGER